MKRKQKKYGSKPKKNPKELKPMFKSGRQYRSAPEAIFGDNLKTYCECLYEPRKVQLWVPTTYIPDFYIPQLDLYIEYKGTFMTDDRKKLMAFSEEHVIMVVLQKHNNQMFDRKATNEMWLDSVELPYIHHCFPSTKKHYSHEPYKAVLNKLFCDTSGEKLTNERLAIICKETRDELYSSTTRDSD